MSPKIKHVCLLGVAQLGCFAAGLWLQQHFVAAEVEHQAENRAYEKLAEDADLIALELQRHVGRNRDVGASLLQGISGIRIAQGVLDHGFLVTDADRKIVLARDAAHADGRDQNHRHTVAEWTAIQSGQSQVSGDRVQRAWLQWDGTRQLATIRPLPAGAGFLVVFADLKEVYQGIGVLRSALGAVGVMTLIWTTLLLLGATYMIVTKFHDAGATSSQRSRAESLRQAHSLIRTRDAVIFGLAKLADSRDKETGSHLERISVYCRTLAEALHRDPQYAAEVTPAFVRLIGISSALHDIGKVGIADSVLLKRGPFTPDERKRMERHSIIGEECLRDIERRLGSTNFLQMARQIAAGHHEHWDGRGYPYGLRGTSIPLAARIVAVADVYDALASRRVYKEAYRHEDCVGIISSQSGTQFDPGIVDVWLTIETKFRDIARRFSGVEDVNMPCDPSTFDLAGAIAQGADLSELTDGVPTETVSSC